MIIGVPKEIKDKEFRVAVTPAGVYHLVSKGHRLLIEKNAGVGSGITDKEYRRAGAKIISNSAEIFLRAEMIVKVKEPLAVEYDYLRDGLIIFTYLHLAPLPELTQVLIDKKVTAIGYETVQLNDGSLPLLSPMSEVAGKLAVQAGAHFLEKEAGGSGILLGGVRGTEKGKVLIIGSGTVGSNAAAVALGMGAEVTIIGSNRKRLTELQKIHSGQLTVRFSEKKNIEREITKADLVIGAVLVPGGEAPKLITRKMLRTMKKGSVIADVAIDQGGCTETSRPTTHSDPVYEVEGIIHYCVANMPGAVPRTSTFALTNATLPYISQVADLGAKEAYIQIDPIKKGMNVFQGLLVNDAVAKAQERPLEKLIF